MATGMSASQIGFVQIESSEGTIPNSGGTATVANANAFRFISLDTPPSVYETIQRRAKAATLSATAGSAGRGRGNWSTTLEFAGSGAAGTAPDIGPFLQALFGKAPTVTPATSVVYDLEDASPSLSVWNFRDPAGLDQLVAAGAVVGSATFDFSGDQPTIQLSGSSKFNLSSKLFASYSSAERSGLSAFPARPSAPVTNGTPANSFAGSVTINGVAYSGVMSRCRIQAEMNRAKNERILFNGALPGAAEQGIRSIVASWDLVDSDVADLSALKVLALSKTVFDITLVLGATAGNIWTFLLKNCQLDPFNYTDGDLSWGVSMSARATATSLSAKDEFKLTLT